MIALLKNIWKDAVWSKVIATAIIAGIGAAYASDAFPIRLILSNIIHVWTIAGSWAASTSPIPNWLSLLTGLFALPTIFLVPVVLWKIFHSEESAANWKDYTEDEFFGIRWRWRYVYDSMSDPHTFCPHCDFQVYPRNESSYLAAERTGFQCEACQRELGVFEESYSSLENKAKRFAQQKLRNGSWNSKTGSAR